MNFNSFIKNFLIIILSIFTINAFAGNIYVNNSGAMDGSEIYCTNSGNDVGNLSSASAPFATLKYALSKANSGDVIYVDAGDYKEKALTISKSNITIIGAGPLVTKFHPASPGISGVYFMKIIGASAGTTIDNIKISNLYIYGYNNVTSGEGEALTMGNVKNLLFDHCVFGKSAGGSGEAVIEVQSNSNNVLFNHIGFICQTQGTAGGGVEIGSSNIDVTIDSSSISFNNRSGGMSWTRGAGVYMHGDATVSVKIKNTTIANNIAQIGGGIYVSGGILTMDNCCITGNSAITNSADFGGGVTLTGTSGLCTFTNCDFSSNSIPASKGGGIAAYSLNAKIDLALVSCTFNGNTASANSGTDLYTKQVFGKVVTVTASNCTFSSASTAINNTSGTITLTNCGTYTSSGTIGGDLLNRTTVTKTNCPSTAGICGEPCDVIDSIGGKKKICNAKTTLTVYGNPKATFYWFSTSNATVPFHVGKTYTTSLLSTDTTFYVNSSLSGASCYSTVTVTQDCKCDTKITKDTTICIGTIFQLKAWTDSTKKIASTPNITNPWVSSVPLVASVTNTGLLTGLKAGKTVITYTDNNNCVKKDTITVLDKPIAGVATPDEDTICNNTSTQIKLTGYSGTIQWQNSLDGVTKWKDIVGAKITPYSTPILTTGTYYYRALVSNTICGQLDSSNVVTITVSPTSVAGIPKATPDTICAGKSALLTLTGNQGKIQWQESADGSNGWINIVGATGDTTKSCTTAKLFSTMYYRAMVKSGACPSVQSSVIKVIVNPILRDSIDIKSDQTETLLRKQFSKITVCPDTKVTYTASTFNIGCGVVTYQWKNGATNIVGATKNTYATIAKDFDSIYCVISVAGNCCLLNSSVESDTILSNVIKNNLVVKECKAPSACGVCDGEICVEGSGSGDVSWSGPSSGTHTSVTLTIPGKEKITGLCKGSYTITFTNGSCIFPKVVTLTDPNAPEDPIITYTNDSICEGGSITLTATGVTPSGTLTYIWYKDGVVIPGQTTDKLIVNAILSVPGKNESHKYAVKANDNGCTSNADSVIITFVATPSIPTIVSKTQTFCKSDKKTINDLTKLITNKSDSIIWFNQLVGGTMFTNNDLLKSLSYYAEQSNGICASSSRLKVDVTIIDVQAPTLPGVVIQPSCDTLTGSVNIDLPSADIWDIIATPVVGFPTTIKTGNLTIVPFTFRFKGLKPGTYTFVCKDINGCSSPSTTSVTINPELPVPNKPVIDIKSIYCASNSNYLTDVKFNPKATGTIKYYDAAGIVIASPATTKILPNTHYQFSFFNGTCESKKLDTIIALNIGPKLKTLDLTNKVFCASDKPTFNSLISNFTGLNKGDSVFFSSIKSGNSFIPNTTIIGAADSLVHKIYYSIKDSNTCLNLVFDSLTYKINLGPTDLLLKNGVVSFCAKNNPTVANLSSTKVSGAGTLKWYLFNGTLLQNTTPLSTGNYYGTLTNNKGCESITTKPLIVMIVSLGETKLDPTNKYTFCKGDKKLISDLPTDPYSKVDIVWFNQNKVMQLPSTTLIPGTYFAAEMKDSCVSDMMQEVQVVFLEPMISLSPEKLPTCELGFGMIKVIGANSSFKYQWFKDGGVMIENGSSIAGLLDDTTIKYMVKVTDTLGCTVTNTYSFDECEPAKPPHIFTPDGNGKNDKFILNYATKYPKCKLLIYNRWGSLVYESLIPYTDSWDGKANVGSALGDGLLPAATYFYLIDKGDGSEVESGFVELAK